MVVVLQSIYVRFSEVSGIVPAAASYRVAQTLRVHRSQVAAAAVACERYIGTMGGGMDQTISCMAQAGNAVHIRFNPTVCEVVPLPKGCC